MLQGFNIPEIFRRNETLAAAKIGRSNLWKQVSIIEYIYISNLSLNKNVRIICECSGGGGRGDIISFEVNVFI